MGIPQYLSWSTRGTKKEITDDDYTVTNFKIIMETRTVLVSEKHNFQTNFIPTGTTLDFKPIQDQHVIMERIAWEKEKREDEAQQEKRDAWYKKIFKKNSSNEISEWEISDIEETDFDTGFEL